MRFMMIVKASPQSEAGIPPSPELVAAIGKVAEEARQAGILLDAGGLLPSALGARVHVSGGRVSVTDGPFAEAKELIGGYAVFELPSREAAIEQGRRFMEAHARVLGPEYEGELEIRQMFTGERCGEP
ncbi:MAG TPA: YciI family protein [Armatimonadota bacterium]|nr:YciI family protein [Armatimonadota bacterium]